MKERSTQVYSRKNVSYIYIQLFIYKIIQNYTKLYIIIYNYIKKLPYFIYNYI